MIKRLGLKIKRISYKPFDRYAEIIDTLILSINHLSKKLDEVIDKLNELEKEVKE